MADTRIGLKKSPMQGKIKILKNIQNELEDKVQVSALLFGAGNAAHSKGQSQVEMEALNAEYTKAVASLAKLVESTVLFLESTSDTFEKSDNAMADSTQKV